MSRYVPPALQAHIDSGADTMTFIMRIEPRVPGFPNVGCTMLDKDIVFDGDGRGELTYSATLGMTPSTLSSTSSMGVDNGENQHLIPEGDMGISEADLNGGAYDYANWWLYWVNYMDLTMGHVEISRGQLGQIRIEDGMTFWSEITSLAKLLKVPVVQKSSRTCRATFGSQPLGTIGAEFTERFPCGKDLGPLWLGFTVGDVGEESNRTFQTTEGIGDAGTYMPAMVKWTVGKNAGRQYEVEDQDELGVVSLAFETMFPIEEGDEGEIRRDCTKWKDDHNGCKVHWGVPEWTLHYRGEPDLKPQDSDSAITPGAAIGKGVA